MGRQRGHLDTVLKDNFIFFRSTWGFFFFSWQHYKLTKWKLLGSCHFLLLPLLPAEMQWRISTLRKDLVHVFTTVAFNSSGLCSGTKPSPTNTGLILKWKDDVLQTILNRYHAIFSVSLCLYKFKVAMCAFFLYELKKWCWMFTSSPAEPGDGRCLHLPLPDTLFILMHKWWVSSIVSLLSTEMKGGVSSKLLDSWREHCPWEQFLRQFPFCSCDPKN